MFELMDAHSQSAVIKVIGVGGGGSFGTQSLVTAGCCMVDLRSQTQTSGMSDNTFFLQTQ